MRDSRSQESWSMQVLSSRKIDLSPITLDELIDNIRKRGVRRMAEHIGSNATLVSRFVAKKLQSIDVETLYRLLDAAGVRRPYRKYSELDPPYWKYLPLQDENQGLLFERANLVSLRPCKKCGCEAVVYIRSREIINGDDSRGYRVECTGKCTPTSRYRSKELDARLSWNRRNR